MTEAQRNEYDETKKLLKTIRKLNTLTPQAIREQLDSHKNILGDNGESSGWEPSDIEGETNSMKNSIQNYWDKNPNPANNQKSEKNDLTVINNVEIVINSTDEADLTLNDDEKGKISQMIDDFRSEVSEITDFGKLNIYDGSAKLDGNVKEVNLGFTLSAGDDNGLFLSNSSMLQINDTTLQYIDKLKKFQIKFNDIMDEIISNRQQN